MDERENNNDMPVTADLGERLRTWRMFLSAVRWSVGAAAILLLALLVLRTHG